MSDNDSVPGHGRSEIAMAYVTLSLDQEHVSPCPCFLRWRRFLLPRQPLVLDVRSPIRYDVLGISQRLVVGSHSSPLSPKASSQHSICPKTKIHLRYLGPQLLWKVNTLAFLTIDQRSEQ